ncbi:endonuclease/exonuclease/phosphatase family protein [Flavivirga spongiicola]|uniref:Endonuclease/exonuclease/phosphatase family protein n=1 Tax=Flavivirga spongiicola TaxID=421621 RepID=A0ABU7XLS2_9FLAO|nr:endonuclease/exonuclease/phosphatase family protein [Flavivirga sp. MEBiC05379]MDO5981376.1 LamG-like jellyroll fold domain-containing protein [Flavivirga sp. MEBiC05379]
MKKTLFFFTTIMIASLLISCELAKEKDKSLTAFDFDKDVKSGDLQFSGNGFSFVDGIDGQALAFKPDKRYHNLSLDSLSLDGTKDFSVQCWVKTTSEKPTVFLSQKDFKDKSILTQKNAGWALYSSGGTFAWAIGSGNRRINYERDNGNSMPVNDGDWHQLTITYNKERSEFRLYYDGHNKAIYKVNFDFLNQQPLVIGATENNFDYENNYAPDIISGQENLQRLVDEFNALGIENVKDDEFLALITNPNQLFKSKLESYKGRKKFDKETLSKVIEVRKTLGPNPYTVFQNMKLTVLKPVSKIYGLQDGKVHINEADGKSFTMSEKLYPSDFTMDQLSVWERTISSEDVLHSYNEYKESVSFKLTKNLKDYTVGVWNIWHGGIHWSLEKDGWDSRMRIVEMIKEKNLDVVLMQETYSNGDFIAAELGYYFATTSDWDYCYQGANISVLSRYPIKELQVSEATEFNNVAVKLAISETQDIWAMSNWYGMNNFPKVYDFHESKFSKSDSIPVLFGGDFNAVPHTDGGRSPASKKMLENGFTDAYRSLYPDVEKYPGYSHQGGVRIDQLYYKGKGIENTSTEVISTWPNGFPSDHFLIVSKFKLNY